MLTLLLAVTAVIFAIGALRAKKLLVSAIWLAGVSALLSVMFYLYGAHQVAVIELSVGAGLVTVLFVFAISISGDEVAGPQPVLPLPLTVGLVLLFVILLAGFILRVPVASSAAATESTLADVLWQQRGLDVLVQVVLIFSGVLGLLGLLAETSAPLEGAAAAEISARRDRELKAMESRILGDKESRP